MEQSWFKRILRCVGLGIAVSLIMSVMNNTFFAKPPKVSDEVIVNKFGSNLQDNLEKISADPVKASRESTMKKVQEYENKVKSGEIIRGKEERDKGLIAEQKEDLGEALHWYWAAGQSGYDKNIIEADKKRIADKRQAIQDEWKRICASQSLQMQPRVFLKH